MGWHVVEKLALWSERFQSRVISPLNLRTGWLSANSCVIGKDNGIFGLCKKSGVFSVCCGLCLSLHFDQAAGTWAHLKISCNAQLQKKPGNCFSLMWSESDPKQEEDRNDITSIAFNLGTKGCIWVWAGGRSCAGCAVWQGQPLAWCRLATCLPLPLLLPMASSSNSAGLIGARQCSLMRFCTPSSNPEILDQCCLIPQTGKICTIKMLVWRAFHSRWCVGK